MWCKARSNLVKLQRLNLIFRAGVKIKPNTEKDDDAWPNTCGGDCGSHLDVCSNRIKLFLSYIFSYSASSSSTAFPAMPITTARWSASKALFHGHVKAQCEQQLDRTRRERGSCATCGIDVSKQCLMEIHFPLWPGKR